MLRALLETYIVNKGFHRTYPPEKGEAYQDLWGHAEFGEARTFLTCLEWQMGRETATDEPAARDAQQALAETKARLELALSLMNRDIEAQYEDALADALSADSGEREQTP